MGITVTQPNPDTVVITSGVDADCEALIRADARLRSYELFFPRTVAPVSFGTAMAAVGEGFRRMVAYDKALREQTTERRSTRANLKAAVDFVLKQQEEAVDGPNND